MEEEWIIKLHQLKEAWLQHLDWSHQRLAEALHCSKAWVKKWLQRIRSTTFDNEAILLGQSRARKQPPPAWDPLVIQQLLKLRDHPPHECGRTLGPLAFLYYLHHDPELQAQAVRLPRSTRTVWKILQAYHRIPKPGPQSAAPEDRPAPGVEWGLEFHDVSSVPAEPQGKQQPVVEILNLVDHGSSAVVALQAASDYNAESALRTLAGILAEQGCPRRIRMDRDPRWVGSWTAKDFPSALMRFLQCLGIEARICPPHRPDKNPFVERYHRNFKSECQLRENPADLSRTCEVNQRYVRFYNFERPNQAMTCGNQPPRVKFPENPSAFLSPLPATVDPDRWVLEQHGKVYQRRLDYKGCFQLGNQTYYVQQKLHGQMVWIGIDGPKRALIISTGKTVVRTLPIKGLQDRRMPFPDYLEFMCREAVSESRRVRRRTPTYRGVMM